VAALSPTTIQNLIQVYGFWVLFPMVMLEGMGIPVLARSKPDGGGDVSGDGWPTGPAPSG